MKKTTVSRNEIYGEFGIGPVVSKRLLSGLLSMEGDKKGSEVYDRKDAVKILTKYLNRPQKAPSGHATVTDLMEFTGKSRTFIHNKVKELKLEPSGSYLGSNGNNVSYYSKAKFSEATGIKLVNKKVAVSPRKALWW